MMNRSKINKAVIILIIVIVTGIAGAVLSIDNTHGEAVPVDDLIMETPGNGSGTTYEGALKGVQGSLSETEAYETADNDRPETIRIVMVGDILLHTPVEESAVQSDGSRNFDALFVNTCENIKAADIAIVNQEVIIGGQELGVSGYPAFNAPTEIGDALVNAGFDVVCHATNHALDKGKRGVQNTLEFWNTNYPEMGVIGINGSTEDRNEIYVYECCGVNIAILNYTYGTNGIPMPADMPYAVNMLSEQTVAEDICRAEEIADFTIVCPHWGTEYSLEVSGEQKKWAKIFMENGADLVLGTHPHVIEPIEWMRDENTGNEMLIYYSIGNYVNWTSGTGDGVANRMLGGMADIMLEVDDGKVSISDYGIVPIVSHVESGVNGVTVYRLSEYTEALAARNEIVKQDGNFSLEYLENLCSDVWDSTLVRTY